MRPKHKVGGSNPPGVTIKPRPWDIRRDGFKRLRGAQSPLTQWIELCWKRNRNLFKARFFPWNKRRKPLRSVNR